MLVVDRLSDGISLMRTAAVLPFPATRKRLSCDMTVLTQFLPDLCILTRLLRFTSSNSLLNCLRRINPPKFFNFGTPS